MCSDTLTTTLSPSTTVFLDIVCLADKDGCHRDDADQHWSETHFTASVSGSNDFNMPSIAVSTSAISAALTGWKSIRK